MLPTDKITEFSFHIYEFKKEFNQTLKFNTVIVGIKYRNKPTLSVSEVSSIVVHYRWEVIGVKNISNSNIYSSVVIHAL